MDTFPGKKYLSLAKAPHPGDFKDEFFKTKGTGYSPAMFLPGHIK